MRKSAIRECEEIAFNAITISSVLGSIVVIAYFLTTDIMPFAYFSQVISMVFCIYMYLKYKKANNRYKLHLILMLFYFNYNFIGLWYNFSYRHPMVVLFLMLVMIGNVLLLKLSHIRMFIVVETIIIIGFLIYDYKYRYTLSYPQTVSLGRLLGTTIIMLTIGWIIYKYKIVINDKVNTLEEYSFVDPLTKAKNSRAFADDYQVIMSIWERRKISFALINIDINNFKSINDTYGHQVGDDVLIELVEKIKTALRKGEYIYRIGGDEFVILLKGSNRMEANKFIERIVRYHKLAFDFSISYGIADSYEAIQNEELLSLADKRMYANKHPKMKFLDTTTSHGGQMCFEVTV